MTDMQELSTGVIGLLGLAALVFGLQVVLWPTLSDEFRDRLFRLRRELFLFMADGGIAPDHPAYRHLRTRINSLIFYADRLSLWRTMLDTAILHRQAEKYAHHCEALIASAPSPEAADTLKRFNSRIHREVARHLILRSPVLWAIMGVAAVFSVGLRLGARTLGEFKQRIGAAATSSKAVRAPLRAVETEADYLSEAA